MKTIVKTSMHIPSQHR